MIVLGSDAATLLSTVATAVAALVSSLSLLLLSRQIRDAHRFGGAPAFCALLKELEEHLRGAGVLPREPLCRALAPMLNAYPADPRFRRIIEQDAGQHEEVLLLAKHLGRR